MSCPFVGTLGLRGRILFLSGKKSYLSDFAALVRLHPVLPEQQDINLNNKISQNIKKKYLPCPV